MANDLLESRVAALVAATFALLACCESPQFFRRV
jgi:hypothetical protein